MSLSEVVRAWKDPVYRASLSEAERAQLPGNPAGIIELSGTDLDVVAGGNHCPRDATRDTSGTSGTSGSTGTSGSSVSGGSGSFA